MTTPSPSPTPSEHPVTPQASTADLLLIERLPAVLAAALPAGGASGDDVSENGEVHAEVHAEALHQLCLADGILELLDWTHQGVGADPLACFWLASLRWHRLVTGDFPASAPQPPSRSVDAQLSSRLRSANPAARIRDDDGAAPLTVRPGTACVGVAGLAPGEMAYPADPAQPEVEDPAVLLRVVPLALVPYIDDELREQWVRQAVSLTQGHPRIVDRAQALVRLFHRIGVAPEARLDAGAVSPRAELEQLLAGEDAEAPVDAAAATTLRGQLEALGRTDATDPPAAGVPAALRELVASWRRVTLPAD